MTAKPVPEHISDERLAEMLAVTEHVPNGDWTVDGWEIISSRRYPIATIDRHSRDAEPIKAHLLNCHPDTIAALLTELQHRREAEAGAPEGWVLVPREPTPEMEMSALKASRACTELPDGLKPLPHGYDGWSAAFIYRAMLAASQSSPASGVRVKAPTFAELKRDAENAVDALAAYAHNNEALEDACGESAKAMVAATWNRVKAEQALTAIRDMTFKSAPALSAEHP